MSRMAIGHVSGSTSSFSQVYQDLANAVINDNAILRVLVWGKSSNSKLIITFTKQITPNYLLSYELDTGVKLHLEKCVNCTAILKEECWTSYERTAPVPRRKVG